MPATHLGTNHSRERGKHERGKRVVTVDVKMLVPLQRLASVGISHTHSWFPSTLLVFVRHAPLRCGAF